jgi:hypothetical protein
MKEFLKDLRYKNKNHFELVLHLWLNSDGKGIYAFNIQEVCSIFNISKTSLYRLIQSNEYFEVMNLGKGFKVVKFNEGVAPKKEVAKAVKKSTDSSEIEYNGRLRKFLREFYDKHDFDYPELEKHFRFALNIQSKMDELIKVKNDVITEDIRFDSFCIFFEKLPVWWVENKKLSLATLNKNFTSILNQIKASQNGDKFNSLKAGAESIDFSEFTNGN